MVLPAAVPATEAREAWVRRARLLAWLGLGWHVIEAAIAIAAGAIAGSIALVGFGVDSVIEVGAGVVVLWLMAGGRSSSARAERRAQQLIAASFAVLAAYIAFEAARDLIGGHRPQASWVGIGLSVVTLATMPPLAAAKRRAAEHLGSSATASESRQTMLCAYLSAALLVGLARQRRRRLVVGRPARRPRHRRRRCPRSARGLARRNLQLLRIGGQTPSVGATQILCAVARDGV